jgi:hypothetical protein
LPLRDRPEQTSLPNLCDRRVFGDGLTGT